MARRQWTAGVALLGFAVGLWLSVAPYGHRLSIGRMEVSGRCPPAVLTAFTGPPDEPFYDLGSGDELPAQLCARRARRRLASGTAVALLSAAVLVAGRTTWGRQSPQK